MAIPESQLVIWSHQGSITQSAATYQTIKAALESIDAGYSAKRYKVFLQGSYGNDTNIYAESDVDIVIELEDIYYSDLSMLPPIDRDLFQKSFNASSYSYEQYKKDVIKVLRSRFGADVNVGEKAISIASNGNRRKADVIVAMQFREYVKFNGNLDSIYDKGICFFNADGDRIANFPRYHSANLTTKHQSTSHMLKPLARVLKNIRSNLVEKNLIQSGVAPSYYLEGLLYNVPDYRFSSKLSDSLVSSINWIQEYADVDKFVCANEKFPLLMDNSHTSWNKKDFGEFLYWTIELWNQW